MSTAWTGGSMAAEVRFFRFVSFCVCVCGRTGTRDARELGD